MKGRAQQKKPRVLKVDSVESWDYYVKQATSQGCPIAVHLTASWCMPSVAMNPIFEELALIYPYLLFITVDVDDVKVADNIVFVLVSTENRKRPGVIWTSCTPEVATRMEVKAMPTFVVIKEGAMVDKLVGANPQEIKKMINNFVKV